MRIGALVGLILWGLAHAAGAACTHTGGVTTWYVNFAAPSGGDGTSLAKAFNSPYSALSANSSGATQGVACAGDTILWFNNAVYNSGYGINGPSGLSGLTDSNHLGTSALPITIQGADINTGAAITNTVPAGGVGFRPSAPLAVVNNPSNFALQFQNTSGGTLASGLNLRPLYIVMKDIAIESTDSPNTLPSTVSAFGTTCGDTTYSSHSAVYIYSAQNLTFQYDEIACSGGGGFQVTGSDYITLDHSIVHDNAHYVACTAHDPTTGACTNSGGRGSGISYLKPFDWQCDTVSAGCNSSYQGTRGTKVSPTYTNWITNNFGWNNFNSSYNGAQNFSDGEWLILDRTYGDCEGACGSQDGPNTASNWPNFTGKFLVANNIAVGSGGPAFYEYDGAAPVDFINNVSWNNLMQSCPVTATIPCRHQGAASSGEIYIFDYKPPALAGLGINVIGNLAWTSGATLSGTYYSVTTPVPFSVQSANCQGAVSSNVCFINVKNNIFHNNASNGAAYNVMASGTNPISPTFVNAPVTTDPGLSSPNDSVTADLRLSYDLVAGSGLFTGTTSLSCAGGATTSGGDYCTPDVIGTARTASFFGGAYAKSVNGTKGGGSTGSTVMGGGMIGMGCGEACASAAKFLFLHE